MTDELFPAQVYQLWRLTVLLAAVLFVPLAVYSLHRLWRTAASIRQYTRDAVAAAQAIGGNTGHIPALDATITVASEMLDAAQAVAGRLHTIAQVMETRAGRR